MAPGAGTLADPRQTPMRAKRDARASLSRVEVPGVIRDGKVVLPASVNLPEGAKVRVVLDVPQDASALPFEREPLTWEDIEIDLQAAKRLRFGK